MDIIASTHNSHIRYLRSLYTKKGRDAAGCYAVEGVNIVKDIPAHISVAAYYVADNRYDKLAPLLGDTSSPVYVVQSDILAASIDTVTPAGLVAVLPIPTSAPSWQSSPCALVLDGVADPGNMGTLVRTAVAAGYAHILVLGGADPYAPKVVRATMGGIYRACIHCMSVDDYVAQCGTRRIYIMDMQGQSLFAAVARPPFDLVVGSEAHGVSPALRGVATHVLSIPMQGGIESLNAAVAGSIAMYVLQHNI